MVTQDSCSRELQSRKGVPSGGETQNGWQLTIEMIIYGVFGGLSPNLEAKRCQTNEPTALSIQVSFGRPHPKVWLFSYRSSSFGFHIALRIDGNPNSWAIFLAKMLIILECLGLATPMVPPAENFWGHPAALLLLRLQLTQPGVEMPILVHLW